MERGFGSRGLRLIALASSALGVVVASGALGIVACRQPPEPVPITAPVVAPLSSGLGPAPTASAAKPAPRASAANGAPSPADGGLSADGASSPPYRPDPKGFGDRCEADADCGWDDPCMPTRCIAASGLPATIACDESALPPGRCECVGARCTLRPNRAPEPPAQACELHRCGLDQGAGRCVVGAMLEANWPPLVEGPMCECDRQRRCVFSWVDKIPCKTDAECWVVEQPRRHPVRRTPRFQRPFRPCEDAETVPACVGGFCGFGMGFGC